MSVLADRNAADRGRPRVPMPRVVLLVLAGAGLLAGLTASLVLLGVWTAPPILRLAGVHGVLMTLGFLGTLIALERAVALGRPGGYLAPGAAGLGSLALVAGAPIVLGGVLLALGAAGLIAIYAAILRIERTLHGGVQALGAGAWLVAALGLAAGGSVATLMPWLAAYLVLTVMGERLELSRFAGASARRRRAFVVVMWLFVAGVTVSLVALDLGVRVAGLGLVGIAAWGFRYDLARRTVRSSGVTRFIAVCLLAGYAWLAVGGTWWAVAGATRSGFAYDASLHAVFLGFVMSMVFGHAPVILPGVLRLPLPYNPLFYAHVALLHAGLVVRVVAGDLLGVPGAWQAGGVANVAAVLAFLGVSLGATAMRRPARARAA